MSVIGACPPATKRPPKMRGLLSLRLVVAREGSEKRHHIARQTYGQVSLPAYSSEIEVIPILVFPTKNARPGKTTISRGRGTRTAIFGSPQKGKYFLGFLQSLNCVSLHKIPLLGKHNHSSGGLDRWGSPPLFFVCPPPRNQKEETDKIILCRCISPSVDEHPKSGKCAQLFWVSV